MVSLAHSVRDPAQRLPAPHRTDLPASQGTPAAGDAEARRVVDLLRRTLDRLPE